MIFRQIGFFETENVPEIIFDPRFQTISLFILKYLTKAVFLDMSLFWKTGWS